MAISGRSLSGKMEQLCFFNDNDLGMDRMYFVKATYLKSEFLESQTSFTFNKL